ncbi:hypothetical protein LCGC14_1490660, partial [marine sediment metagenome]
IWYQESMNPLSNGTVLFSEINFTALNSIGGQYNYTILWSNSTALGGIKSNFIVNHQSSITLLKPDDTLSDLITEAFVGDIIPVRIQLKDSENNNSITGALVTYNWSDGLKYLTEAALGVYEAILDTSDLGSNGFYEIFINSSKIGFKNYNITLKINLVEETNLLRQDSFYYVELHDNTTVKYSYTNSTGGGISGASISLDINNYYYNIIDNIDGNYTIEVNTSYINTLGVNQINLNFSAFAFESQIGIFQFEIIEQSINISVHLNSQEIQENSLTEKMFKENINISVRIMAKIDLIYLTSGNMTWNSDNFYKKIMGGVDSWYNFTIPLSSTNFTNGLNYIYIRFEQNNYKIKDFGFQVLISEQTVNISTYINGEEIVENYLKELQFKDSINISAKVFVNGEAIYLSGAKITFFSENYQKNFTETIFPWYNISFVISSSYFNLGINYAYLEFQLGNYTTTTFSFQFLISQRIMNISTYLNGQEIVENYVKELTFRELLNISVRIFDNGEAVYLSGVKITFFSENYQKNFTEAIFPWYNVSFVISSSYFKLGSNPVYLELQLGNYSTTFFSFQIFIDQIEIQVDPLDFESSINALMGETIIIEILLKDPIVNTPIENATVKFVWEFGVGIFNETGKGVYQYILNLPENLKGNYQFNLIVTTNGTMYETTQSSFVIVIGEEITPGENFPSFLVWSIIGVLASIISILGILSFRSYILLPRQRRKEADLLAKTQKFKDLTNLQAIVVIHRISGIPIYTRSYSILEKHKKEMFSGFIQAITTIGEEFIDKDSNVDENDTKESYGVEKIIELDFKYFYCLIADKEDVRAVVILKDKSSERLKSQLSLMLLSLNLKLSQELDEWDGSLDLFEEMIPPIINEYIELYYKDAFKISKKINIIKLRKEKALSKMEIRALNVIQSYSERNDNLINLNNIISLVSEENKDLIIEAIESLIKRKMIIPVNP